MEKDDYILESQNKKISLTKENYDALMSDASAFGFVKKNGAINKNNFINTLIFNYFDDYRNNQNELLSYLKSELVKLSKKEGIYISDESVNEYGYKIIDKIVSRSFKETSSAEINNSLVFRPSKDVEPIIRQIHSILGDQKGGRYNSASISGYLRSMISSYLKYPRNHREQIIFKNTYQKIENAIKNKRYLIVADTTGHVYRHERPWGIVASKEEFFNYILFLDDKGNPRTIRLSRVLSAEEELVERTPDFSDDENEIFENICKQGPQYPYKMIAKISVELTEKGKREFNKIYTNRPFPDEVRGNIYLFSCSEAQAFNYFKRFGKEAIILEPIELKKKLMKYYREAIETYEN